MSVEGSDETLDRAYVEDLHARAEVLGLLEGVGDLCELLSACLLAEATLGCDVGGREGRCTFVQSFGRMFCACIFSGLGR